MYSALKLFIGKYINPNFYAWSLSEKSANIFICIVWKRTVTYVYEIMKTYPWRNNVCWRIMYAGECCDFCCVFVADWYIVSCVLADRSQRLKTEIDILQTDLRDWILRLICASVVCCVSFKTETDMCKCCMLYIMLTDILLVTDIKNPVYDWQWYILYLLIYLL